MAERKRLSYHTETDPNAAFDQMFWQIMTALGVVIVWLEAEVFGWI